MRLLEDELSPTVTILADGLGFPEGPVWLEDGSLVFVEIAAGLLSRLTPDGRKEVVKDLGGGPNGAAVGPDGAIYVCNNGGIEFIREPGHLRTVGIPQDYSGGRIERVDPRTGAVDRLYEACGEIPLNGPNDIVFDAHGGFYFTDLGKTRARVRDRGVVYYARPDGSEIVEVIFGMTAPNGIALSPDGRELYVCETDNGRLWGFNILSAGVVEKAPYPSPYGGRLLLGAPGYQRFDSMAVEECGNICMANIGPGGITVVTPDDGFSMHVPMPDRTTTNICFGGADMKDAWITLSSTGRLAHVRWARPGLKLNFADRLTGL